MDILNYNIEIQDLVKEIQKNRGRDPKALIEACDKLEELGKKHNDNALLGYAFFSRGETYYLLNDATNFYSEMLSCLGPMESQGEWGYVAMANNMLGIMSLNRGNAPFALDYYIKAISICEDYGLPDIEWIIHMNLGSLYLNIEEYKKALMHIENAYRYLIDHDDMPEYIENLTTAYLGMARAYLKLDRQDKYIDIADKLQRECIPFLPEMDRIVIYCFFARMHQALGEPEARDRWILKINEGINSKMPVMDVFDDFYDYMEMLLNIERYDDFFKIYNLLDILTKKTTIKNLERKLLTLKIRYFRRSAQIEEYKRSSVLYFEMSEFMERENRLMVSNMLVMRNSYQQLADVNKKVEKEKNVLQKRSETDPLTGLNNRYKLNEHSETVFDYSLENNTPIAVEILDIDYFKQYNDNYGHQKGDECIQFIARKLFDLGQGEDIFVARYGGDEFVIIYQNLSEEDVIKKVKQLRANISEANMEHKFSLCDEKVTISQGICYGTPREGTTMFGYLQRADQMLYKVKKQERNSFMICNYDDQFIGLIGD